MWVLLDATGRDGVTIEARASTGPVRSWAFDETSAHTDLAHLLDRGGVPGTPDDPRPDAVVRWEHGDAGGGGPADVEVTALHRDGAVDLELAWTGLDRDVDVEALVSALARIFTEIHADPYRPAAAIPLISPEQHTWLTDDVNAVRMEYPDPPSIHSLVCRIAATSPEASAVVDRDDDLTYAALVDRARATAARLRAAGARPGEAIGVMFGRGIDCVVSMLGVLLADGVYAPVPMEEPEPRREQLLEIVGARLVLEPTDDAGGIHITVRDAPGSVVPGFSHDDPGSSPIYVTFTSGSTGTPKAVVVPHRAVVRLVRDPFFVGISPDDGIMFASNPGFDAASWEVWGALCNGARLVVADAATVAHPDRLETLIRARGVTCLFLTTSLFNAHARSVPGNFGCLRALAIGGEAADPDSCRRVLESDSPPASLLNAYGPTEAATFASWYRIKEVAERTLRLPIGRPIVNTTLHVLDRRQRLVPPGMAGQLFIGGDALALGYFRDVEQTSQRFVPDPFAGAPRRLYATGDLAVRRPTGEIVSMGRLDEQLKIRGFRVEPREVEIAIQRLPGVSAAVVAGRVGEGQLRLVAYVVAESDGPDPATIRRRLRADLPDYLVPSHVMALDALPLTKSGKLDRARLPDPFAPRTDTAPATPDHSRSADTADSRIAVAVADIWKEVLGIETIDPDATFFDVGGDSLIAVRLYGSVQRRLGVVLPGGLVGEDLTIDNLTTAVRDALTHATPPLVIELSTTDGPAVVLIGPGGGELYDYRWLVRALESRFHLFGVREPGHYGTEPRPRTVAGVSFAIARAIDEAGVERPLAIVGECVGGVLAHTLACDLDRAGRPPRLVALLDTPVPGEDERQPRGVIDTLRRRSRNASALARMNARWAWYRTYHLPAPPELAHAMTLRANVRRMRNVVPSHFSGRLLYVKAMGDQDESEGAGSAEYWRRYAATAAIVEAPGAHSGPDSYLSPSHVGVTADALARELALLAEEIPT